MPEPIISPQARADLDAIDDYIAQDDPKAADRMAARFDAAFETLARMPFLGRLRPELGGDIRSFVVGNYLILYQPTETTIVVAHIYHGARDIESILRDEES